MRRILKRREIDDEHFGFPFNYLSKDPSSTVLLKERSLLRLRRQQQQSAAPYMTSPQPPPSPPSFQHPLLLRSFSHLPALPLQTPDALLMPLGAHSFKRVSLSLFHKQNFKQVK